MDFSFMLRAEKMLRPSCVPWELHGPAMNGEGKAAMYYFTQQGHAGCTGCYHVLSTSDLYECHAAAVQ